MSELTVEDLEQKIARVDEDLKLIHSQGGESRKVEVLTQYKEYLEEELADAKKQQKAS